MPYYLTCGHSLLCTHFLTCTPIYCLPLATHCVLRPALHSHSPICTPFYIVCQAYTAHFTFYCVPRSILCAQYRLRVLLCTAPTVCSLSTVCPLSTMCPTPYYSTPTTHCVPNHQLHAYSAPCAPLCTVINKSSFRISKQCQQKIFSKFIYNKSPR